MELFRLTIEADEPVRISIDALGVQELGEARQSSLRRRTLGHKTLRKERIGLVTESQASTEGGERSLTVSGATVLNVVAGAAKNSNPSIHPNVLGVNVNPAGIAAKNGAIVLLNKLASPHQNPKKLNAIPPLPSLPISPSNPRSLGAVVENVWNAE